jgi:hypothetical protein
MSLARLALFLCALTVAACLGAASPIAASENDCSGAPSDAVMKLPAPLNKWGKIVCTPFGNVVASQAGWAWIHPRAKQQVFVPAQMVEHDPLPVGNAVYFTKIEVSPVGGDDYAHVYDVFHQGFDGIEESPKIYRAKFVSVSGDEAELYFLDFSAYAWGMWCPEDACDAATRFIIVSKTSEARQGSI